MNNFQILKTEWTPNKLQMFVSYARQKWYNEYEILVRNMKP
jgi:hypothetical protein